MAELRPFRADGGFMVYCGNGGMKFAGHRYLLFIISGLMACRGFETASETLSQSSVEKRQTWKPVQFAIVRFNEDAPKSWNIYHTEKKGVLLVRLWKRYILVNVADQEVYDLDPEKIKPQGDNMEWSPSDLPEQPVETAEWKIRDVGPVKRIRFRFGKNGSVLDIQLPLLPNGKPAY